MKTIYLLRFYQFIITGYHSGTARLMIDYIIGHWWLSPWRSGGGDGIFHPSYSRNSKGFRSFVLETGVRGQNMYLLYHSFTDRDGKLWIYNPHLIGNWLNLLTGLMILERSWFLTLHFLLYSYSNFVLPHLPPDSFLSHVEFVWKWNRVFPDTHNIKEEGWETIA